MSSPSRVGPALIVVVALAFSANGKGRRAVANYSLIDVLVWSADMPIDTGRYGPPLRKDIDQLRSRSDRYRSRRPAPLAGQPELKMVYDTQVAYERLLVQSATSRMPDALAVAYVTAMEPCYEW